MRIRSLLASLVVALVLGRAAAALPPTEVVMRGSQPPEIVAGLSLAQPDLLPILPSTGNVGTECSNCHFNETGSDTAIHPSWRGSMMAHASRDPLMWAALAVAQQDFPGVGDTCIRCHVTKGWIEGRSVPADGSALLADDADGVTCHLCHRLANPDASEAGIVGTQASNFAAFGPVCATDDAAAGVACDAGTGIPCAGVAACSSEAFHGNAMIALFQDAANEQDISRLGPYSDPQLLNFHGFKRSTFVRDAGLCGTCHDVSNPVTGDLAPSHGRLAGPLPSGAFSGVSNGPALEKAGVRNPPYAYGVEQRTYSEWIASALSMTLVSAFDALPAELKTVDGAIQRVSSAAAPNGGDYADGTPRGFTCQSCHLRPASAQGCYIATTRSDMPVHDLMGANTWAPRAILYLDDATLHGASRLRLGGGLDADARTATTTAAARAEASLRSAASLALLKDPLLLANTVRVVNLTGHKLFTGYPEGRRMWLDVKWYGPGNTLVREDGAYGPLDVAEDLNGDGVVPDTVQTLLDPQDPHTHVWNVQSGISKQWAARLVGELGVPAATPLAFDRATGAVTTTLGDAAAAPGANPVTPSLHLALNDVVIRDDRIPPWRMDFAEASKRNALPVPATLYLASGRLPENGAEYLHYDDVPLDPPIGAVRGEIALLYQTASWEYVQFLWKSNAKGNAFLASVGDDVLEAWLATGQSAPVVMATATVPEPDAAPFAGLLALALLAARRRSG